MNKPHFIYLSQYVLSLEAEMGVWVNVSAIERVHEAKTNNPYKAVVQFTSKEVIFTVDSVADIIYQINNID